MTRNFNFTVHIALIGYNDDQKFQFCSAHCSYWLKCWLKISISTVYKTLSNLEELALAEVDKYVITPDGKKIKLYRSRIGKVEITLEDLEPTLNLHPNDVNSKSIT